MIWSCLLAIKGQILQVNKTPIIATKQDQNMKPLT